MISLTESEWKQAYAAGAIQPNVPFLGATMNEREEEEKDEEIHTSTLGIDEVAEQVRTLGPTQSDIDHLLKTMDDHPTVDWTQGKNLGSHYTDGQPVPCMAFQQIPTS